MGTNKGQGAVEFVAILGMMLLVVLVVMTISNQRLIDLSTQKLMTESRSSVKNLADAANHVYAQGTGAKKYVFVRLPGDMNFTKSFIANRTIIMNVRGTDISALTDGPVQGTFPSGPGGYWFKVESLGGYVQIGNYYLEIDKGSLYVNMANLTTTTVSITALNRGNRTLNVTMLPSWSNSSDPRNFVYLSASPQNAIIDEASSYVYAITLQSGNRSAGIYTGLLTFNANFTDGDLNETIDVPITVEVNVQSVYQNVRPDLNQSTLVIVLLANASSLTIGVNKAGSGGPYNSPYAMNLFVCARPGSDVADVNVFPMNQSSSIFGIYNLTPSGWRTGVITPGQCKSRVLNFTSNATPTTGSYLETINATPINGSSASPANSAILQVTAVIDATGPAIVPGNVSVFPQFPINNATVYVNTTDTGGPAGDVWVSGCTIQNSTWSGLLTATDGAFNSLAEGAKYNFTSLGNGNFQYNVSCNDSFGNWGANVTVRFTVDSQPPLVSNFSASCGSLGTPCGGGTYGNGTQYFYLGNPVWLNFTADDRTRGSGNITACSVYVDANPAPYVASAYDGLFNDSFEFVNSSLGSMSSSSSHNVSAICTDTQGNSMTNYTFFIVISTCQNITSPGLTQLQSDVFASGGDTCFNITSNNAILDCKNHQISGTGGANSYAIRTNGTGVSIGNCTLSSFYSGILVQNNSAQNGLIANVTSNSNTLAGIYLNKTNFTSISGFAASSNAIGIYVLNSNWGNVTSGTIYGTTALQFSGSSHHWINQTYMNSSGVHMFIDTGSNNTFSFNNITGSGIWLNNTAAAGANYFNTSLAGVARGNSYWNITSYNVFDAIGSPDGYADHGAAWPLNQTGFGAIWNASVLADYGPATSRQS